LRAVETEYIMTPNFNKPQKRKGYPRMTKKLLLVIAAVVLAAGGWFVHLLWSAGQFKTLEPHFAGECTPITGINVSADGKSLYLCATTEGVLHIYQRDVTSGKLKFHQKLKLGTGLDNLEIDSNGGLWIAAHPQLLTFVQHAQNSAKISPSQILHLIPDTVDGTDVKEIYLNLGEEISASSVAAIYNKRMLIGAVFDAKFLDCKRN
jgi:hypothetical protein